ncbi:peptidase M50 [Mycolicibacterium hodleri]|uniref:Peptidase M50 n=1 Tax=Mycolicibacterium hodleri TaxID=49897 RepID=A0A502DZH4_9MYCO|nr:peptidase M50 [Mycolicibacterium hodleri]TPG29852.1 peptidase M50 [Mycolicibacterium hodleri]
MAAQDVVVLNFGERRVPRPLAGLPVVDVSEPNHIDAAAGPRRLIVLGTHADLAVVLARLLRADRLDVEVAHVRRQWQARRARTAAARRVPLIRDETGAVLVRAAYWLPPDEESRTVAGEAVVDDTLLFDGEARGVRIEPMAEMPGLRVRLLTGRLGPRRWVTGRAAQLGTTGVRVVRDGVTATRPARRSTFYRHTQGWLAVR